MLVLSVGSYLMTLSPARQLSKAGQGQVTRGQKDGTRGQKDGIRKNPEFKELELKEPEFKEPVFKEQELKDATSVTGTKTQREREKAHERKSTHVISWRKSGQCVGVDLGRILILGPRQS